MWGAGGEESLAKLMEFIVATHAAGRESSFHLPSSFRGVQQMRI